MKEDLSQPFYIPIGKGKVNLHTGQRGGYYLPALEPKCEEASLATEPTEPQWRREQWEYVQQLRAQILFLSNKVNELRANASKRKSKDTYVIK